MVDYTNLKERFGFYRENRELNINLLDEAIKIFDYALESGEYSRVNSIPGLFLNDKFIMTGEANRILNILSIYAKENENGFSNSFFCGLKNFDMLHERYIKTILYLRRIELAPCEDFSNRAYDYVLENCLSPYAVDVIVTKEYFEKRDFIIQSIYEGVKEHLSDDYLLEWLSFLDGKYGTTNYKLEKADLFLKYMQYNFALDVLLSIAEEDINENITSVIDELKEVCNGL